ncbi:LysR family transcriptional regulator [Rhodobacteraceae bacterium M382]|nr:LysR family transcriptional regulator [Rhodobacteraceae bacterium M382]
MSDLPNLVWLRAFEASARLRSFTAAADELGLTQAAVSHQIRSLEKSFGVTLFIRRARHLELTEIGHAYYPSISQALDDIAYSTRGLIGPGSAPAVTLRAPISTAVLCVAPRLGAFHATHPNIRVRLVSAVWADSTSDTEVDIDVRLGPSSWFDRRAHLLSTETVIPVASPTQAPQLTRLTDLFSQTLIHIHGNQDHWLRLSKHQNIPLEDRKTALFVDTTLAAIELAASGAGAAMVMRRYAEMPFAQNRLAQVGAAEIPMGQGHYLMPTVGERPKTNEVTLVRDWITSVFEA